MHETQAPPCYVAFHDSQRLAAGGIQHVATKVKEHVSAQPRANILIFDIVTSETVELDLRGKLADVLKRLPAHENSSTEDEDAAPRGPGRPKLGVVAREVTLLPRHWEWLSHQPGGASVALRKLVEEARRANAAQDRLRMARESAYRFMSVMAGNLPGFEEATRALFAANPRQFVAMIASWPKDVRDHAQALASATFSEE